MGVALLLTALLFGLASAYEFAIPFYHYPNPTAQWDLITGLNTVAFVVFNPSSGPGNALDNNYLTAITKLHDEGQESLGYVYTSYGERPLADVKQDIDKYFEWYPIIRGIFLDEAASDAAAVNGNSQTMLSYYTELRQYVRGKGVKKGVILNFGVVPSEALMQVADVAVVFEGPFSAYEAWADAAPAWLQSYPKDKFWHIVHTCPFSSNKRVVEVLAAANANFLYVTDLEMPNPYTDLPTWAVAKLAPPSPPPPPPPPATMKVGFRQTFYPSGLDYDNFKAAFNLDGSATPRPELGFVALNPNSGPGAAVDANYAAEAALIQAHGGLVLGNILLNNADPSVDYESLIDTWYDLYQVDGFYLDQTWSGTTSYFASIRAYAQSSSHKPASSSGIILLAPGWDVNNEAFGDDAGILQLWTYDTGDYGAWQSYTPPAWTASYPASKFYHFVNNVPSTSVADFVTAARAKNAGYVFITDNYWGAPTYLAALVSAVAASNPPPPPPPARTKLGSVSVYYPSLVAGQAYRAFSDAFSLEAAPPASSDAALGFVVFSPSNGAGAAQDGSYLHAVQRVQAHGGLVLGYIPLGNANPSYDYQTQMDRYYDFYGVDGFYLDQTWSGTTTYFTAVRAYAQSSSYKPANSPGIILLAPGWDDSNEQFAAVADILQLFNGDYAAWQSYTPPAWTASYPASKFYHFVSAVPAASINDFVTAAKTKNAGYVQPTDTSIYSVATYLPDQITALLTYG